MAYGYLKLIAETGEPVPGASSDAGRMGWTDVLAFSIAAQKQRPTGAAKRPGAAARWEMRLTRYVDTASRLLYRYRTDERKFQSGLLEIPPGNPQLYQGSHDRPMPVPQIVYLFEDVGILDIIPPSGNFEGRTVENLVLDAARMGWSYRTSVPPTTTYAPGDKLPDPAAALDKR